MTNIIKRLHDSSWGGVGLGREAASVITELRLALSGAKGFIAKDREIFLRCHATPPEYDPATLTPSQIEILEHYDRLLADIDAALRMGRG